MGLRSGDSGSVFHHSIPLSAENSLAHQEVCFGSLSCINKINIYRQDRAFVPMVLVPPLKFTRTVVNPLFH